MENVLKAFARIRDARIRSTAQTLPEHTRIPQTDWCNTRPAVRVGRADRILASTLNSFEEWVDPLSRGRRATALRICPEKFPLGNNGETEKTHETKQIRSRRKYSGPLYPNRTDGLDT